MTIDEEVECVYVLIAFSAVPESFGERVASDFQFRNLYISLKDSVTFLTREKLRLIEILPVDFGRL